MSSIPFWGKLSESEKDEYYKLSKLVSMWAGYCSLSKTKKATATKPYEPTNDEFMRTELLAMKGCGML